MFHPMFRRCVCTIVLLICVVVFSGSDMSNCRAAYATELSLPVPTQMLSVSRSYSYPVLKGLTLDPADPMHLEFLVDTMGQEKVDEAEAQRLVDYFLAAVALPQDDLWVNLSPYEKDRVVTDELGATQLGETLLAQDYLLKQFSSSLTEPNTETGKAYWSSVSQISNLKSENLKKIWITPETAEVFVKGSQVFVTEATLEIESEDATNAALLPAIKKEVNEGERFAPIRQAYYSMVLGLWFKEQLKASVFKDYIDGKNVNGISSADPRSKEQIFDAYVESFRKGVYANTAKVRESGRLVKKTYFSGGFTMQKMSGSAVVTKRQDAPAVTGFVQGDLVRISGRIAAASQMNTSTDARDIDSDELLRAIDADAARLGVDPNALKIAASALVERDDVSLITQVISSALGSGNAEELVAKIREEFLNFDAFVRKSKRMPIHKNAIYATVMVGGLVLALVGAKGLYEMLDPENTSMKIFPIIAAALGGTMVFGGYHMMKWDNESADELDELVLDYWADRMKIDSYPVEVVLYVLAMSGVLDDKQICIAILAQHRRDQGFTDIHERFLSTPILRTDRREEWAGLIDPALQDELDAMAATMKKTYASSALFSFFKRRDSLSQLTGMLDAYRAVLLAAQPLSEKEKKDRQMQENSARAALENFTEVSVPIVIRLVEGLDDPLARIKISCANKLRDIYRSMKAKGPIAAEYHGALGEARPHLFDKDKQVRVTVAGLLAAEELIAEDVYLGYQRCAEMAFADAAAIGRGGIMSLHTFAVFGSADESKGALNALLGMWKDVDADARGEITLAVVAVIEHRKDEGRFASILRKLIAEALPEMKNVDAAADMIEAALEQAIGSSAMTSSSLNGGVDMKSTQVRTRGDASFAFDSKSIDAGFFAHGVSFSIADVSPVSVDAVFAGLV
jgi:hypothetical protein